LSRDSRGSITGVGKGQAEQICQEKESKEVGIGTPDYLKAENVEEKKLKDDRL
jgi:hypothetical protein